MNRRAKKVLFYPILLPSQLPSSAEPVVSLLASQLARLPLLSFKAHIGNRSNSIYNDLLKRTLSYAFGFSSLQQINTSRNSASLKLTGAPRTIPLFGGRHQSKWLVSLLRLAHQNIPVVKLPRLRVAKCVLFTARQVRTSRSFPESGTYKGFKTLIDEATIKQKQVDVQLYSGVGKQGVEPRRVAIKAKTFAPDRINERKCIYRFHHLQTRREQGRTVWASWLKAGRTPRHYRPYFFDELKIKKKSKSTKRGSNVSPVLRPPHGSL